MARHSAEHFADGPERVEVSYEQAEPFPPDLTPAETEIIEAVPVLEIKDGQPVDWLAAVDAIEPYTINPPYWYTDEWADHLRNQLGRAMWYMMERLDASAASDLATIARRTAVILNAEPEAPEMERMLGIRLAIEFEGQGVKCRNPHTDIPGSRLKWTCLPEFPYYDATTAANGICDACALKETRTDQAVPVLEGAVVTKATRPRKQVRGSTTPAITKGEEHGK